MAVLTLHLPGPPVPLPRPRAVRTPNGVRMYTPAKAAAYKLAIGKASWECAPEDPWEGPVRVHLCFKMPIPVSWPRWKRRAACYGLHRPCVTPDLDNLIKSVLDGITDAASWWADDRQVVELSAVQWYAEATGVRVTCSQLITI